MRPQHLRITILKAAIAGLYVFILVMVTIFAYEFYYVHKTYNYLLSQKIENSVDSWLLNRAHSSIYERYHEGRDYFRNIHYAYNQYGFRYSNASDEIILTDSTNIVCVGDSLTEGQFLFYNETVPFLLNKKFVAARKNVRVYNLGRTGTDTSHKLMTLQSYHDIYKPKIVIWQWFLNDYYDYYREYQALLQTFNRSFVYDRTLRKMFENKILSYRPDDVEYNTKKHFEEICNWAQENDVHLIFVMYPLYEQKRLFDFGNYRSYNDEFLSSYYDSFSKNVLYHNFSLIEIKKVFPDYDYASSLWSVIPHDPHPSERSNELLADFLYDYLLNASSMSELLI